MFRITADWLRKSGACIEARDLLGDGVYTLQDALDLALTAGHDGWCRWGIEALLWVVDDRRVCAFAARRARSVEYLWPPESHSAYDAAVRCVERVAAGENVRAGECLAARIRVEALMHLGYQAEVVKRAPRMGAQWADVVAAVKHAPPDGAKWAAVMAAWCAAGAGLEVACQRYGAGMGPWAAYAAADAALYAVLGFAGDAGGTEEAQREAWRSTAGDLQALLDG